MEFISLNETTHIAMYNNVVVMEVKNCNAEKAKQNFADCILTPEGSDQSFRFDLEADQFVTI
ncbi:MAG: hypothetical protein O9302_00260 [Cyclobacteriaceae bacterium]|jgi:hypothetical protein|nr:hypothetical protein [Cytophagales bacterium]MCZ8326463.1 hypothetical protein [Cyclobacteriaceae bacterium]